MQPPRILIAEDEQTTASELESRLRALRYDVSGVVSSSADAVRAAARDHPDLILMDLRLNCRLDGVPAGRKIRHDLGIPVVYLAERRDAAPRQPPRVPRPFGLLRKPFEDSALLAVIETTLAHSKVQQRLRRSDRRYRLLYERSPAIHVLVGPEGAIRDLNRAATHVLGCRKDQILGRRVLDFVVPEHGRTLMELLSRGFRGETVGEAEIDVRAADGSVRTILVTPGRFVLGARDASTALITGIDITERRRAERQAAEQCEQIEHARRLQSLADLAGGFAHHFNNLLTVIQGNAQLLRSGRHDPREADQMLDKIIGASERAAKLSRRLLGFAQKGPHEPRPVDLHIALRAAAQMLRPGLDAAIRVRLDLRSASGTVPGDAPQLREALLELGLNARDAMPAGGEIVLATEDVAAGAADRGDLAPDMPAGPYVLLSVTDTGVGMDATTLRRAAEPFFTTKRVGRGAGLGLAGVYGCIRRHGGCMRIVSRPGKGTSVRIYLPAARGAVAPDGGHAAAGDGRVMVVDDEPAVRELATRALRGAGFAVEAFADGAGAIDYFGRHHRQVGLVLLDMVMPDLDGQEVLLRLRKIDPEVRAVLCSGCDRARGVRPAGFAGLLPKPFDIRQLLQTVSHLLRP